MKINWRYAMGEIIIVIIGITIAFGLNNWAHNRSERKIELFYLQNLEKDIKSDIASLDHNISLFEQNLKDLEMVIPHLGRKLPGRDTIFRKVFALAETPDFIPEDATYHTLVNSGDFKLIGDFELKSAIEKHYRQYEHLKKEFERRENFSKSYMADFFVNLDYPAIYAGNFDFLDNKRLQNLMLSLKGITFLQIKATKATKENAESLLADIQSKGL